MPEALVAQSLWIALAGLRNFDDPQGDNIPHSVGNDIVVLEGHYGHLESNAHETPCLGIVVAAAQVGSYRHGCPKITLRLAVIKGGDQAGGCDAGVREE